MTYNEAMETLNKHLDEVEALPEDHAKLGDAMSAIHDYVRLLEYGLQKKTQTTSPTNDSRGGE